MGQCRWNAKPGAIVTSGAIVCSIIPALVTMAPGLCGYWPHSNLWLLASFQAMATVFIPSCGYWPHSKLWLLSSFQAVATGLIPSCGYWPHSKLWLLASFRYLATSAWSSLVPRPSRNAERGSGVLSDIS